MENLAPSDAFVKSILREKQRLERIAQQEGTYQKATEAMVEQSQKCNRDDFVSVCFNNLVNTVAVFLTKEAMSQEIVIDGTIDGTPAEVIKPEGKEKASQRTLPKKLQKLMDKDGIAWRDLTEIIYDVGFISKETSIDTLENDFWDFICENWDSVKHFAQERKDED
ncbi:hypothetical protein HF863_00775 [Lactobacillus agilis]|uniref:Uncharacterized protein n=1 Tax=Ligilactobacillus agilis TaxID=1601 RepID=A0A848C7V9_9LACO|nr:hypothetical protein [Ligilactobacillus agilis]MCL8203653.1 hypothetical protein [Ligilactobacillus agilis]NME41322.1 hypothetical protein [Ligilactobacillus agilis]